MKYKGYTVTQASNGHIIIGKDGCNIRHVNCSTSKNEKELQQIVDTTIEMREKSFYAHLVDNGLDDLD